MEGSYVTLALRGLVSNRLAKGCPSIDEVAAALGISVRTLQRRLNEDGITYRQLVGEVRLDSACRLLDDPQFRAIEVANALGYTDPSNFSRAFARMAGLSPAAYQRLSSCEKRKVAARCANRPKQHSTE